MSGLSPQLDVDRDAVVVLLGLAKKAYEEAQRNKSQWAITYWDGYTRALEQILEMENE
jgi:hypothetical protein